MAAAAALLGFFSPEHPTAAASLPTNSRQGTLYTTLLHFCPFWPHHDLLVGRHRLRAHRDRHGLRFQRL
eukprot:CAMPEP_0115625950 /NCGR_PEP_ID=MMETSP0272-20121206/28090_1 /TAXON_ID=71861 /ORGANISM="Scrippsiella trochoidea, Strain CCMP3099" /LENGTH=68 /DNA_ID=CAMNT_0003062285 /DNA_START=116 /DNA_END=319 /DNA_ORIENTATION=+